MGVFTKFRKLSRVPLPPGAKPEVRKLACEPLGAKASGFAPEGSGTFERRKTMLRIAKKRDKLNL
jgi:hypothetical protein